MSTWHSVRNKVHQTFRVMRQSCCAYSLRLKHLSFLKPYSSHFISLILLFPPSFFPVEMRQSCHAIIQVQSCWMFNLVYNCSLLIHKCSPHIHFGSENRHEKDSQANTGCNVVRLCTLMSYDYRCSCRTFIATHVVRHDNLIKTALRYSCLSLFKYTKTQAVFQAIQTLSLHFPDEPDYM